MMSVDIAIASTDTDLLPLLIYVCTGIVLNTVFS